MQNNLIALLRGDTSLSLIPNKHKISEMNNQAAGPSRGQTTKRDALGHSLSSSHPSALIISDKQSYNHNLSESALELDNRKKRADTWRDRNLNDFPFFPKRLRNRLRIVPKSSTGDFTGRQRELKQMNIYLEQKVKSEIHYHVNVAVVGPIGYGKTELMLKFVFQNTSRLYNILWLNYENELSTKKYFINVAKELKIDIPEFDNYLQFPLMLSKIYDILCRNRTILIIDNVENCKDLDAFLPTADVHQTHPLFVAVTSHNIDWECNLKIHLDVYTPTESLCLLKKLLPNHKNKDLKDLTDFCEGIPELIKLSAKILKEKVPFQEKQLFKIDEFISKFKQNYQELMERALKNEVFGSIVTLKEVINTITKLLSLPESRLVSPILQILAMLDFDNISDTTFNSAVISPRVEISNTILALLKQFSIIQHVGDKIVITRMMQELIIYHYKINSDEYLTMLLMLLEKNVDTTKRYPKFKTESFASHALKVWLNRIQFETHYIEMFSKLPVAIVKTSLQFAKYFTESNDTFTSLEQSLGYGNIDFLQLLILICNPKSGISLPKALNIINIALEKIPQELRDNECVLRLSYKKSSILTSLEKYDEAWSILEALYHKQRDNLGINNDDTLETLEKMCEVAAKLANKQAKIEMLEMCLSHVYQRFSNTQLDHIKSLRMMKYIPEYLHGCKRDDEALRLYDCLQETFETMNGPTDAMTLQTQMAKADCLIWLKKYDEAWDVLLNLNTKQIASKIDNIMTILKMCTTSELMKEERSTKCWDLCSSLITEKIKNKETDQERLLYILNELCFSTKKQSQIFELYELLYQFANTPNSHPLNQRIVFGKIDCLIMQKKYEETWKTLHFLYKIQLDHKLDFVKTVATMCQVSCEIDIPYYYNEWCKIMNSIIDFDVALVILENVVSFNSVKTVKVLPYYDSMLCNLRGLFGDKSPAVLRTKLGKSWHMWCLDQRDNAWNIYEDVCRDLDFEPEQRTIRRWDFCNYLGKLIKILKEMN